MYNKIQPEQIEIHTFSSPTGNILFEQGTDYVYADLNNDLTGQFNINGSITINGSNLFITDSTNSYTLNNNVILGGKYNTILFGSGNAVINSFNSAVNGKNNLDLNSNSSIFDTNSNSCTILAGKNNLIPANISGSAIISDFTQTSTVANENNKFYISFQNGTDFAGNVGINDDLILNNGSRLLLHPNASGIFSGAVVIDNSFTFRDGSSVNGSSSYPTSPTDTGDKGRFAYVDNNFFIKNNGRWIKFFGNTGNWENFVLNSGSLKLKTIDQFTSITGDLISWDNGILNQSILGVTEITSFPSFGGLGSLIVPDTGGTLKTLEWQNGLITSTGLFNYLGLAANGKSGSFNISTTTGVKFITWKDGQITSTGDSSFSIGSDVLVYMTGDQAITGKKTFNIRPEVNGTGVLLQGEVALGELPSTIVYTTGNQLISGIKTFTQRPFVNGSGILLSGDNNIVYATGDQTISGVKTFATGVILQANNNQLQFKTGSAGFTGSITMPTIVGNRTYRIPDVAFSTADFVLNTGVQSIGGLKTFTTRPEVNGVQVLLAGEGGVVPSSIVYATGDQLISGTKSFVTGVILQANNNQLQFRTGSAGNAINITASTINGTRTYTIPDIGSAAAFVLNSGTQNIGGLKTFTTRPEVNGTGVLLQGEAASSVLPGTIVYINDTQAITAVKTFNAGLISLVGITGTNLVYNTGNQTIDGVKQFKELSIVNTAGDARLEIGGTSNVYIDLKNPNTDDYDFRIATDTADAVLTTSSGSLNFNVSGINRLHLNKDGKIGIGTLSPTSQLHVVGNSYINGQLSADSAIFTQRPFVNGSGVLLSGENNVVYVTGNQEITGTKSFATGVILQAHTNQIHFKTGSAGNVMFINVPSISNNRTYTIPDVGVNAAFVLNSGAQNIGGIKTFAEDLIASGNIGVGTNSPTSTLDVRGVISNFFGTTGTQTILQNWGYSNAIARWKPVIESDASLAFYGYDTAGGSPAQRLIISNSNGNVGIGTAAPNSKLHVVGNSYINGGLTGNTLAAISSTTSHSQGAYLEWNKVVGDGQTYLLNQKGSGPGGIVFGDVTAGNTITTGIFLNSSNVTQFYNRPTVNGSGVLLQGEASAVPTNLVTNLGNTSGIYSLSQTAYNGLTPLNNVLYIITGA